MFTDRKIIDSKPLNMMGLQVFRTLGARLAHRSRVGSSSAGRVAVRSKLWVVIWWIAGRMQNAHPTTPVC